LGNGNDAENKNKDKPKQPKIFGKEVSISVVKGVLERGLIMAGLLFNYVASTNSIWGIKNWYKARQI